MTASGGTVRPSARSQVLLTLGGLTALTVGLALPGDASTPPSTTITVPTQPGVTVNGTGWTGSIPPSADPLSDCSSVPGNATSDPHTLTVHVPSGVYQTINAAVT